MAKKTEDSLWTQNGKYMVTVYFGAERLGRYVVKAETYGRAIQKIVKFTIDEYPDSYDGDSEIKFVREIYDDI